MDGAASHPPFTCSFAHNTITVKDAVFHNNPGEPHDHRYSFDPFNNCDCGAPQECIGTQHFLH